MRLYSRCTCDGQAEALKLAEEERDAYKKELHALELSLEISRQDLQGVLYTYIEFTFLLSLRARAFFAARGYISHRARVCDLLMAAPLAFAPHNLCVSCRLAACAITSKQKVV